VREQHYVTMRRAWYNTMRHGLAAQWNAAVDDAARQAINLIAGVMSGAADAEAGPPWWDGTVLEHHRVSRDIAVVRLRLDQAMPYHPGQYVNVQIPQRPRRWRYLSPAMPSDPNGYIEFHVRSVPGGMVSTTIVGETRPGDRWRLSSPHGGLHVDRDGGDVLMVAGSTGLAPLRTLIMDLARFGVNPRVHLFFGARYPCELYDLPTLWRSPAPTRGCRCLRCRSIRRTCRGRPTTPTCSRRGACTSARAADCPRWSVATAAGVTGRS
jgi:hypothetical protein